MSLPATAKDRNANITRLIQHAYADDPYRVLLCCLLLNRTGRVQVRSIVEGFFERWPTPYAVLAADDEELRAYITPLGFYNRRTKLLKEFTLDFLNKEWRDPRELKGIGRYGWEAYEIVMRHRTDIIPTDGVLRAYLEWHHAQEDERRLALRARVGVGRGAEGAVADLAS